ncbi:hypothetical protein A2630_00505 [Candidatus Woesebacteria bacterium RIFCSPHIGHO2_01_FULL_44_10]|uniref:Terminase large subunit gp17-like C-terminal domain-containing protein n=1 Tax=Candidatus Woesebacteria bacterium RIFCSPLOWO2_01_FULL_44_14 TaxID=1802525 RepID=A0A1F8C1T3_9BACT|nr:MAG: hypothetical protein A2630_00505 [Candidatus Woesebacteria bacterium RIFCSPHIGHO2_01_FULL_44_10]OGM54393.1 MAG: hypothetical protein A3F62_01420 [Candidatus Woesebacteria bacterium RIFCSPHIGHO2_12_FULL_44_11]OGM70296.1 MAG: hypothetical protein A2975_04470 [Candidatus Woesebacteria bacterium RIFCSPLOWO2_01_FULL_44_14]
MEFKTADFQKEIFGLTQNESEKFVVIVAFRGSAKSTIMTLSYPIWAMVGNLNKKFIILISQTQQQSRLILSNIKKEFETNTTLMSDFGPFGQDDDEWRANSLVLSKYNTRITAISSGESIRGLRHLQNRPDLIICDDVEDLNSVKTREGRNKSYEWLTGDVIPAGNPNSKYVIIGNLLHEDSLMMRLKNQIIKNKLSGTYKEYPLIKDDKIIWPGKFPDEKTVKEQKLKVASESSWSREFLLTIISDEDRIVHPEWIQYYDGPPTGNEFMYTLTGVDLAISEKDTADYTAMVSASVYDYSEERKIYILPNPINKRLSFPDAIEEAKNLSKALGEGTPTKLLIEEVAYQSAFTQQLEQKEIPAEGVKLKGSDKRARLSLTTHMIRTGKILFPRKGAERLIEQLVGFGIEKHDDLADAFSILILHLISDTHVDPQIYIADYGPPPNRGLSITEMMNRGYFG